MPVAGIYSRLHLRGLGNCHKELSLWQLLFYVNMEELLKYLEVNQELDNAVLLAYYKQVGNNQMLWESMERNERARDTYVRYELWKVLPEDARAQYDQDLKCLSVQEESTQEEPTREETQEPAQEETDLSGELSDDESELIEMQAALYRERAKLSNSLGGFAEEDNAGRAAVLEKIAGIDESISNINKQLNGEETTPQTNTLEYAWMLPDEEIAKMSPEALTLYKAKLSQRRSKSRKAIAEGKNVDKNQKVIDAVDEYSKRLA